MCVCVCVCARACVVCVCVVCVCGVCVPACMCVKGIKKLADQIWKQGSVPADWWNSSLCLFLRRRALVVSVITIVGSPC